MIAEAGREYVTSSRIAGAGALRLMFGTILPNCTAPLIVQATLAIAAASPHGPAPTMATWSSASMMSEAEAPVLAVARTCIATSSSCPSAARSAIVMSERSRKVSCGRDQTWPQAASVISA